MLNKVPYKTIEIWICEQGFAVIKNSNSRIVMNKNQSAIWDSIDGVLNVNELIKRFKLESEVDDNAVLRFVEMGKSIGIINFIEEEWDV